jgi:hypothetical protein
MRLDVRERSVRTAGRSERDGPRRGRHQLRALVRGGGAQRTRGERGRRSQRVSPSTTRSVGRSPALRATVCEAECRGWISATTVQPALLRRSARLRAASEAYPRPWPLRATTQATWAGPQAGPPAGSVACRVPTAWLAARSRSTQLHHTSVPSLELRDSRRSYRSTSSANANGEPPMNSCSCGSFSAACLSDFGIHAAPGRRYGAPHEGRNHSTQARSAGGAPIPAWCPQPSGPRPGR